MAKVEKRSVFSPSTAYEKRLVELDIFGLYKKQIYLRSPEPARQALAKGREIVSDLGKHFKRYHGGIGGANVTRK